MNSHFFVVKIKLCPKDEFIFQDVSIYNSFISKGGQPVTLDSNSGNYLCLFQEFICNYVLNGTKAGTFLQNNPNHILEEAKYCPCPKQDNCHDCGIFAFVTLMFLLCNGDVKTDTFTQDNISDFRSHLYSTHRRRVNNEKPYHFHKYFPTLEDNDEGIDLLYPKDNNYPQDVSSSSSSNISSSDADELTEKNVATSTKSQEVISLLSQQSKSEENITLKESSEDSDSDNKLIETKLSSIPKTNVAKMPVSNFSEDSSKESDSENLVIKNNIPLKDDTKYKNEENNNDQIMETVQSHSFSEFIEEVRNKSESNSFNVVNDKEYFEEKYLTLIIN